MYRPWAFWRRMQYAGGASILLILLLALGYFRFFYRSANCFDGKQNGSERGVDCGGSCSRVCALDVIPPVVRWAQAFRIVKGQYNAVAYVENRNSTVGTSQILYTFRLYDTQGTLIASRAGVTFLPPDGVYPIFEGRISVGDHIPARTTIELAPVENWQPATAGRKQFEVRSRTLVDVDNGPRLNTVLYNTSLKEETNVEVVATIFDAHGNALTASQSVVPRFAGRQEQQVIFTWPEPIAKTLRSCEVPTDVLLAIDLSGSMNNDGGTPPEPITSALRAAESFIGLLRVNDQAGVVTYATTAKLVQGLDGNHAATQQVIRTLGIDPKEETGQTNIADAVVRARDEFLTSRHSQNARKVLVLLTDGKANAPGKHPEQDALKIAQDARDNGITIFTVGLGTEVNQTFLTEIALDESHRYLAPSAINLGSIYQSISTALCEEGPAVIDVVPKIPLYIGTVL